MLAMGESASAVGGRHFGVNKSIVQYMKKNGKVIGDRCSKYSYDCQSYSNMHDKNMVENGKDFKFLDWGWNSRKFPIDPIIQEKTKQLYEYFE